MAIVAAWIRFEQPTLLAITLPVWLVILLCGGVARLPAGRRGRVPLIIGLLLLALAAGGPVGDRAGAGTAVVLVDLSPSTRGAAYRERETLERQIDALLGNTPRHIFAFADGVAPLPGGSSLEDLPADRTRLTSVKADAILLFSDGRFDPPVGMPPTFAVVDPHLEHPADAAIEQLQTDTGRPIATVRIEGPARTLSIGARKIFVDHDQRVAGEVVPGAESVTAQLSPGDRWPENDSLSALPPPPAKLQRWWVGGRDPGPAWVRLTSDALPSTSLSLLSAAAVVLDDLPGEALSPAQSQAIQRYVHDEGGGLLVLGGSHAFEPATASVPLAAIEPLTPLPPAPVQRWVVLGDGSGSMAGGRWDAQSAAVRQFLPLLPPHDSVRVGSFASEITWWFNDEPVGDLSASNLPPAALFPHGPTELERALQRVIGDAGGTPQPTQLLLITDADATLSAPADLLRGLLNHHVTLNVMAVGKGAALPMLTQLASASHGHLARAIEPSMWSAVGMQWVRGMLPPAVRHESTTVRYEGPVAGMGVRQTAVWERTWLRAGTTRLASGGAEIPMAARWAIGSGNVAAAGFAMSTVDAARLAESVARAPDDARFGVTCTPGPTLKLRVDAADDHGFMNGLGVTVDLAEPGGPSKAVSVPQTAPGRYELEQPPTRRAVVATVSVGGQAVRRFAVAGRYAPEFDAIGNDRPALSRLAAGSGGALIEPADDRRIDFHWPPRRRPLTAATALLAAGFLLAGLLRRN